MKGKWTKLYDQYYLDKEEYLKQELKKRLVEATYETDQEILSQLNFFVNGLYHQLFSETADGQKRISWFRERVVDKFRHDKYRYKEGFQVDGFIENILPEIQQEFRRHYESVDERARYERYFDQALAFEPDPEEIIRLLALHDAYHYFFDHGQKLLNEIVETLQKEKHLVEENHFNGLAPIAVLEYMEQLQQINPAKDKHFLTEKQVYDLTNMICKDRPVPEAVEMEIDPSQKRQVEVFFIIFYKYCKDTVDAKGKKEKYISLMNRYIAQFQDKTIYPNNFYLKESDQPLLIKVDAKYLRWTNA